MTKEYAESAFPEEASSITMGDEDTEGRNGVDTTSIDSNDIVKGDEDVPSGESEGDDAGGDQGGDQDDGEGLQSDSESSLSEEDRGAFDPEDEEQVARFDAAFANEDGSLDMEGRLTNHFWANIEAGKEGLDEGVYQYLESKGIKKSTVKQIEAMAVTNKDVQETSVTKHDHALFEVAGGPDKLAEALKWGKEGGYTKEQQARFNKVNSGKDLEAKKEAVEVLMARFNKANPKARPKVPARDATNGGGKKNGGGALPFKDRFEMRQMRDNLRENDHAGWALFRKRRAASSF